METNSVIEQKHKDIVSEKLLLGTMDHNAHVGFLEDYRTLSCLLKKYNPKSIFECGTNTANGVNVMAAALPEAKIFSLDLDYETMRLNSKQYPIGPNGEDRVGSAAKVPYTQLRGDSMTFDYSKYPCEAYWIDSEHSYEHPYHEIKEALKCNPKIIIAHDCDIPHVMQAFVDALNGNENYTLFRVTDTRIAYAVKK